MNRDDIQPRIRGALSRHWRTSIDRSGPTQGLVDDLAAITEQYAEDFAKRVTARKELRDQAATLVVAAEGTEATETVTADPASHRTRTRTRRGEQA